MTDLLPAGLDALIIEAFEAGRKFYPQLELELPVYGSRIVKVLQERDEVTDEAFSALSRFAHLHTNDLFLAQACAQGNNEAWRIFNRQYAKLIFNTAFYLCNQRQLAEEIAQSAIGHLFLTDDSGLPRIHSYDGRGLLSSWVRAVVAHRVYNEVLLKHRQFLSLEALRQTPDSDGIRRLETGIRASRYEAMIRETLATIGEGLSDKERWFLILYYVEAFTEHEIAGLYNSSRAKVNYQLSQARKKLRQEITGKLQHAFQLSEAALQECIIELCENPTYALQFLSGATGDQVTI
ncbi:MAG: sigma-70 family RNA polymerase sigma factor [Acidobacteriota bacterium]